MQNDNKFHPVPGYVLARPLEKEELQQSSLSMPGSAKDKTDSVGIAEVIECGTNRTEITVTGHEVAEWRGEPLAVGDHIAYMPFTDVLIDTENFKKHVLVAYTSIRAVKKGTQDNDAR